jgi:hypothetical protein
VDGSPSYSTSLSVSSPVVSPSSALKSDSVVLMLSHFRSTVLGHSCSTHRRRPHRQTKKQKGETPKQKGTNKPPASASSPCAAPAEARRRGGRGRPPRLPRPPLRRGDAMAGAEAAAWGAPARSRPSRAPRCASARAWQLLWPCPAKIGTIHGPTAVLASASLSLSLEKTKNELGIDGNGVLHLYGSGTGTREGKKVTDGHWPQPLPTAR